MGTAANNIVDANLLLQIITYILLVGGVMSAKRGNYRRHGLMQATAVVLASLSLILVMGPRFLGNFEAIVGTAFGLGSPLTLVHAILGSIALAMGWIANIALRPCGEVRKIRGFGNLRNYMQVLFGLWTLAFVLGLSIYVYFYV